jgi:hypothetical protein
LPIPIEMRSRVPLRVAWSVLLLGAGLTGVAAIELQRQIDLSANGVAVAGKVVDFVIPKWKYRGASADFEIEQAQASLLRVHVEHASVMRDWSKGTTLTLICANLYVQDAACQVDAFADRWLEPTLLLIVGLPAVLVAGRLVLPA